MLIRAADRTAATMTDVELRDQLMTLLVAGHDTTATALSWALERLTRHPAHSCEGGAARRGHGTPTATNTSTRWRKETLRIRPVVFDVGRVLKEPTDVAGHRLPAGVMVAPGNWVWCTPAPSSIPEPDRFDPDRMLGATLSPTTWLPFGGGQSALPRRHVRAGRDAGGAARGAAARRPAPPPRPPPSGSASSTSSWCPTVAAGSACGRFTTSRRRRRRAPWHTGPDQCLITCSMPAGTCLPADRGPGRRSSRTRTGAPRRSHRRPHRRECRGRAPDPASASTTSA